MLPSPPPKPRTPPRPAPWLSRALAAAYLLLAAMLVYFRLFPFERVLDRLEREGTGLPGGYARGATALIVLLAAYLSWRGIRYLRAPRG